MICSDSMTAEEVRALVERAREDEDFPGYFLYCQVGISGVRSPYGWVDSDGFLRARADLADEYEAELDCMGGGDLLGGASRMIDPDGFEASVSIYIGRLEVQGVLIPLYYAD